MMTKSPRESHVFAALGEARGRLLAALCERPMTAVELAGLVGTSANAVRVHLEGLRAAELVDYRVERRGIGKPRHVYALTATGEHLLSSAYVPALRALLETLRDQSNGDFERLLRETGETLARLVRRDERVGSANGIAAAKAAFTTLGAALKVSARGQDRVLSSTCCPLAAIVRETPETCRLMESMLSAATGFEIQERCDRGERPRCAFIAREHASA